MNKLLIICIPTYKRQSTVTRCIDSIVKQIEKFALSDRVGIYVANDASPDETLAVLNRYCNLPYLKFVTREQNFGMSLNIKSMLQEVAIASSYQLIITDDDFLQPDTLDEIVVFLDQQKRNSKPVPAIWTPRYSYTEDGELYCIVCNLLKSNSLIRPSEVNAGRFMENGFVLSGLILCAAYIEYEFWDEYKDNAFFPVILLGDLLRKQGAYYWNKNIVHHTVLNECHWERWGKNDILIELRLVSDFVNSYEVMAKRINRPIFIVLFYGAAFPSIYRRILTMLFSEKLRGEPQLVMDAIHEQKKRGVIRFNCQLRLQMACALIFRATLSIIKLPVHYFLALLTHSGQSNEHFRKRIKENIALLKTVPIVSKIILP